MPLVRSAMLGSTIWLFVDANIIVTTRVRSSWNATLMIWKNWSTIFGWLALTFDITMSGGGGTMTVGAPASAEGATSVRSNSRSEDRWLSSFGRWSVGRRWLRRARSEERRVGKECRSR